MAVRVLQEELPGTIRALFAREKINSVGLKLTFPGIEIIHTQCKMVPSIVGINRFIAVPDEMELLVRPQSKPGAWKGKGWPLHWFELENIAIKSAAGFEVLHMEGHVI